MPLFEEVNDDDCNLVRAHRQVPALGALGHRRMRRHLEGDSFVTHLVRFFRGNFDLGVYELPESVFARLSELPTSIQWSSQPVPPYCGSLDSLKRDLKRRMP